MDYVIAFLIAGALVCAAVLKIREHRQNVRDDLDYPGSGPEHDDDNPPTAQP